MLADPELLGLLDVNVTVGDGLAGLAIMLDLVRGKNCVAIDDANAIRPRCNAGLVIVFDPTILSERLDIPPLLFELLRWKRSAGDAQEDRNRKNKAQTCHRAR